MWKKIAIFFLLLFSLNANAISTCDCMWTEHTRFDVLTGGHVQGKCQCSSCHVGGFYNGSAPTTCWGCHTGARPDAVRPPTSHLPVSQLMAYDCKLCHNVSSFGSTKKPNHAILAGMSCKGCHGANYLGVTSRRVTHQKATAIDCNDSGCHNTSTFDK